MILGHPSRKLAAYIDRQMPESRAARIESHIAECTRCLNDCEQIRLGMAALENFPLVEAPDGMWEWIETDAGSRAAVKIGEIGSVDVEPNTRVPVLVARPSEHRLALARGEIRAKISAPPRLFFVDTAAGTAVDLGCEYALQVDADGFGRLEVTKGWVLFQWKGLESLVPAGASCRTRPQPGPGIPYFDDAPESVKQALERYAFEKGSDDDLSIILAGARIRDTLTLWHLISRVPEDERERVFDRMAALTPVPESVSRKQALKLDAETLKRWREELAWTW
jgi:hypothetical protein